jgi:hypothetical protein
MRHSTTLILILLVGCSGCAGDELTEEDLDEGEVSTAAPTHDPTGPNCPGGSGTDGQTKKPIPEAKDCSKILDPDECKTCCDWNVDKVWGERCRRLPNKTKEDKRARARCWQDAERRRGNCHGDCPIDILTLTVTP